MKQWYALYALYSLIFNESPLEPVPGSSQWGEWKIIRSEEAHRLMHASQYFYNQLNDFLVVINAQARSM